MLERGDSDPSPEHVQSYLDNVVHTSQLKDHVCLICINSAYHELILRQLDILEKEKNEISYIADTQALHDASGYRGLADWSQASVIYSYYPGACSEPHRRGL